jgi:formate dehydrogenase maturation protein FdhE
MSTWNVETSAQPSVTTVSRQFKNEVSFSYETNPVRACNVCGEKPVLLRSMLDTKSGCKVRMFKCKCGEQTWMEENQ